MQGHLSDIDFYERKINRLESDIASLHEELNIARGRLRSAEDYQIKYELLLRQSNHENVRLKKLEEAEKEKFSKLLVEQMQKAEKRWTFRMEQFEQNVLDQQSQQKEQLKKQILSLKRKIQQMTAKTDQMDSLLFKNKKIAKQLESLEEIIQETKIMNQKSKQDELKACRQSISNKFQEKIRKQKQYYESRILNLEEQVEKLRVEAVNNSIKENLHRNTQDPTRQAVGIVSIIPSEIQKLKQNIQAKNNEIQKILQGKLKFEESMILQKRQLKSSIAELEQKIFSMETAQQIELFNLKNRIQKSQEQQIEQLNKKNELLNKQKFKQNNGYIDELKDQNKDLEETIHKLEKENKRLIHDKEKMMQKIGDLKHRLRDFQHDKEVGQTQLLISSFKNMQGKEQQVANYENGINFLEKQLRKAAIKIDKKNNEVKQLINDITRIRNECDQEVSQIRDKYYNDMDAAQEKIKQLQDSIRELNEEIRKRQRQKHDQETEFTKSVSQLKVELRGLRNLNSDLQRDYNRILQSKKVIEKSFRQERERSVTSKSEIANTKKQKWLEMQRQKNQIEIIYKQKQQQVKTQLNIQLDELRLEKDKLKKQNEHLRQQLASQPLRDSNPDNEKENVYSEFHKKLATVNLQIALTQNLYNTLVEAKSRKKIPISEKAISDISERQEEENSSNLSAKFIGSQEVFDALIPEESSLEMQDFKKELDKSPFKDQDQGQSSGGQTPNFNASSGGQSPNFNMLQSFNPKQHQ